MTEPFAAWLRVRARSSAALALAAGALVGACGTSDAPAPAPPAPGDSVRRQFYRYLSPEVVLFDDCAADGSCAGGATCFRLSEELRVCDASEQSAYLQCQTAPEWGAVSACGCDAGDCAPDRHCIGRQITCSCPATPIGVCAQPPCGSPGDCPADRVCLPTRLIDDARCASPACRRDADCVSGQRGRCALVMGHGRQSGESYLVGIECVYENLADAGTSPCPGGEWVTGLVDDRRYYACP